MDQQTPSIEWLLGRFFSGAATEAERAALFELLQRPENDAILKQWINKVEPAMLEEQLFPEGSADAMLQAIFRAGAGSALLQEEVPVVKRIRPLWRWYAAAMLLVLVGAGLWFFWIPEQEKKKNKTASAEKSNRSSQPIQPGTDKAVLILDDGREVQLDNKGNQLVDAGSGTSVTRSNAMLDYTELYRKQKAAGVSAATFHTLSTPRGGQYQLTLSDGSLVWLNAASSVRFPVRFGDAREIEVWGEVYIQVKPNKNKPFFIRTTSAVVEVLGTSININAYTNEEASKVTLVNGSVKVSQEGIKAGPGVVLKPGRQALLYPDQKNNMQVKTVDVQQQIAWKNGQFSFKSTDIAALMRQMERWYNVDVVYPKGIPADRFTGNIPRSVNLNQFLEILRYSDIKATVEGNSVIIKP
ncbi:FecR family protein [Pseudoflavitalea rhizosphaerae]|uniref:FecR family protein n=1 Tax=Pseudoflavitalea rhizosphaerae TaxID=1884793 RepID=UPI000F8D5E85|nr:FecR family protein [Pseudoflavitalea rhizosphaerae]